MSGVTFSQSAGLSRFGAACLASIKRTFPAHIPLYACAIAFVTATFAVTGIFHLPMDMSTSLTFLDYIGEFLLLAIPIAAMARLVSLYRAGADEPLRRLSQWMASSLVAHERPGNVFHSILTFTPLMISFAGLKDQIPHIEPFAWDRTFMQWDRFLGFGRLPWQWLQPLLGHPLITSILNFNYDLWFIAMFVCLFWQAFAAKGSLLRMQFLIAFALAWFIGGNVLAVIFSSAGPCFYGHLFHADPYAAQMAYLRQASLHWPVWSVHVQDMLWQAYVTGTGDVSGISAMPSMHVTSAVLMALLGSRTNKWLGRAASLFAGLIVIGSVALGWHYAVDSIAGAGLAFVFWHLAGAVARATLKLSAPREAG